ncbi:Uncharacterised protein [Vibrio cholerae]|nr:Uncharacterised protein [Vibrio cholerae]
MRYKYCHCLGFYDQRLKSFCYLFSLCHQTGVNKGCTLLNFIISSWC